MSDGNQTELRPSRDCEVESVHGKLLALAGEYRLGLMATGHQMKKGLPSEFQSHVNGSRGQSKRSAFFCILKIRIDMTSEDLETLVSLRAAVGFLGEKGQHDWWTSSFFSTSAATFLAPLFPRTQFLSQTAGVTSAAMRLHDDRIGVGKVFHLFRLPEDLEQSLHRILGDGTVVSRVESSVATMESAMLALSQIGNPIQKQTFRMPRCALC